jgi:hypothetical protein
MTFLNKRTFLLAAVLGISLIGCKQEIPAKVSSDPVFGKVQELKTVDSEKQLIYQSGQDTKKVNWGSASGYYVKIEDVWHPVQWDDAAKFKELKVGDSVNMYPTEFIACTGENDLKPHCQHLMKVMKSDKPVPPLQVVP